MEIADENRFKAAFISRFGLFEWVVLPFGLCNAPSTFQRLMNTTLDDLIDSFVLVYLDDILVYSADAVQHELHLCTVLERLRQHTLYAKRSKCDFGVLQVEYLGHIVGGGKVWADPAKISAISEWPAPTTVK